MARTRCTNCKKFVKFDESMPAVGVAGRTHKLGFGCKPKQVTKIAPKVKTLIPFTFEEMMAYAKSDGTNHGKPLVLEMIGPNLFVPKSLVGKPNMPTMIGPHLFIPKGYEGPALEA